MAPHPLAGMPQTDRQNARVILSQIQASVPTADCLSSGVQSAPLAPTLQTASRDLSTAASPRAQSRATGFSGNAHGRGTPAGSVKVVRTGLPTLADRASGRGPHRHADGGVFLTSVLD